MGGVLPALDAKAEGDERPALEDKVYREEKAQDEQAVDRPLNGNDKPQQQGDGASRHDSAPTLRRLGFEAEPYAECAGTDQCGCQKKGQHTGCQNRIYEGNNAGCGIEQAAQEPEEQAALGLHAKGMDDFDDAGNQHHQADIIDRDHGGEKEIAEGDAPENKKRHPERDKPSPLAGKFMRKAGAVKIIMCCCHRMNVPQNFINAKQYKAQLKNNQLLHRLEQAGFSHCSFCGQSIISLCR